MTLLSDFACLTRDVVIGSTSRHVMHGADHWKRTVSSFEAVRSAPLKRFRIDSHSPYFSNVCVGKKFWSMLGQLSCVV